MNVTFHKGFCQFSYNNSQTCKKFQYALQREVTSLILNVHICFSQMTRVAVSGSSCQNIVTQKS